MENQMSPEVVVGLAIASIVVLLIGKHFRKPKESHFQCARCGVLSPHAERTIKAWRNQKAQFFCQTCHAKWLQSQPPRERQRSSSYDNPRTGCLGAVVVFALVPFAGYWLVRLYS